MMKSNCVNLDTFLKKFAQLEQKITEVNGRNMKLEIMLEDASRLKKYYETKEKSLTEERDSLLVTVSELQQTLLEQYNLRVENERLKTDMADLKQQIERTLEDGRAEVRQLVSEMRAEGERHKRELDTVRQQNMREVEKAHRQSLSQLEAKDAEVNKLLQEKDIELEEMKKRLKNQERERQSEILKLQMEGSFQDLHTKLHEIFYELLCHLPRELIVLFGAKLARVQSTAQHNQQQQQQLQRSNLLPQSVFKRKLQCFQEEKNKEIVALRQRIKELEENQRACSLSDSHVKKRKI